MPHSGCCDICLFYSCLNIISISIVKIFQPYSFTFCHFRSYFVKICLIWCLNINKQSQNIPIILKFHIISLLLILKWTRLNEVKLNLKKENMKQILNFPWRSLMSNLIESFEPKNSFFSVIWNLFITFKSSKPSWLFY